MGLLFNEFLQKRDLPVSFVDYVSDKLNTILAYQPEPSNKKAASKGATISNQTGSYTEEANRILFVENLPANTTTEMLQALFSRFAGFEQARLIPARPGIAFVDYSDDYCAGSAMQNLQGFKFTPTNLLKITYAKK
jgi:U2 small nuclear ribonucleoprotein B''